MRGSEIQQRIAELAMEAVGEYAAPYQPGMLFRDTNETPIGPDHAPPAAPRYFNMRKTTIYGGSTEIQKNIVSKACWGYNISSSRAKPGISFDCARRAPRLRSG